MRVAFEPLRNIIWNNLVVHSNVPKPWSMPFLIINAKKSNNKTPTTVENKVARKLLEKVSVCCIKIEIFNEMKLKLVFINTIQRCHVPEVGRILDTIFNTNACSSSSTSNVDDDFVMLDPPSNQTSSSSSTSTTVSKNSSSVNSTNSLSDEPCATASPQKDTDSSIRRIPPNDAYESSASSSNNHSNCNGNSGTSADNTISTVSKTNRVHELIKLNGKLI